jgi:tRNA nucleotidyltransferase (CCA-adding enzyme)
MVELSKQEKVTAKRQAGILMGRHLVERGLQPGPQFTEILGAAYAAQVDGEFSDLDGAKLWLDTQYPWGDNE